MIGERPPQSQGKGDPQRDQAAPHLVRSSFWVPARGWAGVGQQGGQGEGQEAGVPHQHWVKGPRAIRDSPSNQNQGMWSPCRKIGEGGTALLGWAAGSRAALSSSGYHCWENSSLPWGEGQRGPPWTWGPWQGLGDRVGGREVSLAPGNTLDPFAHPLMGLSRVRTSAGRLSWCRWLMRSWSCRCWCRHWDLAQRTGTAPGRTLA